MVLKRGSAWQCELVLDTLITILKMYRQMGGEIIVFHLMFSYTMIIYINKEIELYTVPEIVSYSHYVCL